MVPVVSIVGQRSNSGKTTLLVKLLAEAKRRGWRVAAVKHDVHGFEMDKPGKDTWRFAQAGADVVVISSPEKMAMIEKVQEERTLEQVLERIRDVDLIFTEGYKHGNQPRIEVFRSEVHQELLSDPEQLLSNPFFSHMLHGLSGVLLRREGDRRLIAIPWDAEKPFPMTPLFCFAKICRMESISYVIFAFDGREKPLMP